MDRNYKMELSFLAALFTAVVEEGLEAVLELIDKWRDETHEPPTDQELDELIDALKEPATYLED